MLHTTPDKVSRPPHLIGLIVCTFLFSQPCVGLFICHTVIADIVNDNLSISDINVVDRNLEIGQKLWTDLITALDLAVKN